MFIYSSWNGYFFNANKIISFRYDEGNKSCDPYWALEVEGIDEEVVLRREEFDKYLRPLIKRP